MSLEFIGTCVHLPARLLEDYDVSEKRITYRTFRKLAGKELVDKLSRDNGVPLSKDWSLSFGRGVWKGKPCICMHHSCIHNLWYLPGMKNKRVPVAPVSRQDEAWIMAVPVVSLSHLPAAERERIKCPAADSDYLDELRDFGGSVFIIEHADEFDSEDCLPTLPVFKSICMTFAARGWRYIRFFEGGDTYDELSSYA